MQEQFEVEGTQKLTRLTKLGPHEAHTLGGKARWYSRKQRKKEKFCQIVKDVKRGPEQGDGWESQGENGIYEGGSWGRPPKA